EYKKHEECLPAEDKKYEKRLTAEEKKREECLFAENKKKRERLTAKDKKRKDSPAYKKMACGLWIGLAVILVAAVPVIYVISKDAVKEKLTLGEGLVCAESFALTIDGNRAEGRNIRAVNTGNRDAVVMAVLTNETSFQIYGEDGTWEVTGEDLVFDYSGVTSVGDGENTESCITVVYREEDPDDSSDDIVFRIYLNTVITYTDLTSVRKDYTEGDLEARDLFDAYQWTFDDASSTETEAYFFCNYIVTPGDHTGELIDRVELASGADGSTGFDYSLKFELKDRQEITPVGYLFGTANGIKGLGWSMEAENICGYYDTDCGRSNYIFWETAR
ncbi:MAG: hypothetical protein LUE29_09385, partial [Lachnospiraceae bacterium]|nr:hypothetical protein [Lachnospiraceae bacterium]